MSAPNQFETVSIYYRYKPTGDEGRKHEFMARNDAEEYIAAIADNPVWGLSRYDYWIVPLKDKDAQ